MKVVNSTAYNNGTYDFQFDSGAHTLINNLAFGAKLGIEITARMAQTANSWQLPVTVTTADFISLVDAAARGARQADGSLPDVTFLHLAQTSDLIDKGVDAGFAAIGLPDLGAFESPWTPGTGTGGTVVASPGPDTGSPAPGDAGVVAGTTVLGKKGDNVLHGSSGDDLIDGKKGNDQLFGAERDDNLVGGKGNDLSVGGGGNDVLRGGKGSDTFYFATGFGNDRIVDFKVGQDLIRFDKDVFSDYASLSAAMSGQKGGVLIEAGDDSVFLAGVKLSKLADHDFLFG
jgi:Ca2+-binding RTX toxin-like protein